MKDESKNIIKMVTFLISANKSHKMLNWCYLSQHSWEKIKKSFLFVLFYAVIINFFITFGCYNYPHIAREAIDPVLYKGVIPRVLQEDKSDCSYKHVLENVDSSSTWYIPRTYNDFDVKGIANGSFSPGHCNPIFSVAILVTYRNRQEHLNAFIPYMHNFLRKQDIHYKIYVIEQRDDTPWNKGLLYNIGARQAMVDGFPCLILHDIDLLPLDDSNLYACTTQPRHFSASIDKHRFVLKYSWLVGGVLSIRSDQYRELNGFSNRFLGWGGEDDDFYKRLKEHHLKVLRFPRSMSRYTMLRHLRAARSPARFTQVAANREDSAAARAEDGLRNILARVRVTNQRLFTAIAVNGYKNPSLEGY